MFLYNIGMIDKQDTSFKALRSIRFLYINFLYYFLFKSFAEKWNNPLKMLKLLSVRNQRIVFNLLNIDL